MYILYKASSFLELCADMNFLRIEISARFLAFDCELKQVPFLIFVVPSIMLYSSEISPTRCNNCVFLFSAMAYVLLMMGEIVTETCRVKPFLRIKTQLLRLVGLISLL